MKRLTLGALALAFALPVASAHADGFAFGKPQPVTYNVIGDTPYGASMINVFPSHIADINADASSSLTLHVGDIKNGSSRCDTSYFEQIRSDFDLFTKPFIYTPGDNEWTDCHRANNGGYQPAGPQVDGAPVQTAGPSRLDEIHRIFFDKPGLTLGQHPRRVQTQGGNYVENVRWADAGATFAMLNVPGSNNDLLPWFGAAETDALKAIQAKEVANRTAADNRWLDETFIQAILTGSKSVVLGIQADMWDPNITGDSTQYSAFTPFVQRLAAWSKLYGRPVLLLNGDSHVYESDTPLADKAATGNTIYGIKYAVPNLQRITVDGSAAANDYLHLTIDTSKKAPFSWTRVNYTTAG